MKKIVLINQSSGYLMIDIVNEFAKRYDEVVLMYGSLDILDTPLNDTVRHSKIIPYKRNSTTSRVFTWVWATVQIFFRLLLVYRKHEIVYVTNPPMCYLSSLFIRRPFSVIIFDTYPDVLKNIGIKDSNVLFKLWIKWNKKLFKQSRCIYTLSDGMKKKLIKYVTEDKIKVIPNWSHTKMFWPIIETENPFIKQNHLENKFIVLYSGNIGYTHNVEVIVEVANLLSNEKDIVFLIIGEGGKKQKLLQMSRDYGINNCTFMTWQSNEVLPYSLASADLAVVTLNDEAAFLSVPSKTYHLLAAGSPLLGIAPEESELNNLILKYQNGACFEKEQITEIANYITKLKEKPSWRQALSENSLKAAVDFTEQNALLYCEALNNNV